MNLKFESVSQPTGMGLVSGLKDSFVEKPQEEFPPALLQEQL